MTLLKINMATTQENSYFDKYSEQRFCHALKILFLL